MMFSRFIAKLGIGKQGSEILRGGGGSIAIRALSHILGFIIAIVLARSLGTTEYGTYSYVLSIIMLMALPAKFGFPKLVVRETAKADAKAQWNLMLGVWKWSSKLTVGSSLIMGLLGIVIILLLDDFYSKNQVLTFISGLVLIPLLALAEIRAAALRGLKKVIFGLLPEGVVRPVSFLIFIILFISLSNKELSSSYSMMLHSASMAVAFIIGAILLIRNRPVQMKQGALNANYDSKSWMRSVVPFSISSGVQEINKYVDILILGIWVLASDVGIYRVAIQGALLVVFIQQSMNVYASPYFTKFYELDDFSKLQAIVTMNARISFAGSLVIYLVYVFAGEMIIDFAFGQSYSEAYLPLVILGLGQVINAQFGSVGVLLNMTGHERSVLRVFVITLIINVILNFSFIPFYGIYGAAGATLISIVLRNLLLWNEVRSRLGINSSALHF